MFRAVIIGSEHLRFCAINEAAIACGQLTLMRTFEKYPYAAELHRLLRSDPPDVVLVDLEEETLSSELADEIHRAYPDVGIVGLSEGRQTPLPGSGITTVISFPPTAEEMKKAVDTAIHAVHATIVEQLYAFLPAKAGSGCSTVVLNTALTMAASLEKKVLVMETDLRSGTIGFAARCEINGSIQRALAYPETMDRFAWDRHISEQRGVHFLLSDGTSPPMLPTWREYHNLLQFAGSRYDTVLVDLPEVINPGTAELVRRAKTVFVVCTQELLALKLAGRRLEELTALGIPEERTALLVTRWQDRDIPRKEVEQMLHRQIAGVFPNDYQLLRKALLKGEPLPAQAPLAASFLEFGRTLIGMNSGEGADSKPVMRFLRKVLGT